MQEIPLSVEDLSGLLFMLPPERGLCMLDSCGVGHLGSHLMIAGIDPVEAIEISSDDPEKVLAIVDEKTSQGLAAIITLSYDLGAKMNGISVQDSREPDLFLALFDALIIHDYKTKKTFITGNESRFNEIRALRSILFHKEARQTLIKKATSNFSKDEYIAAVESIKESIRAGDTYQTNLTRRIELKGKEDLYPELVFKALRRKHPAPFAAYIRREKDTVISASPERFFRVSDGTISVSPIKGTRKRGSTPDKDARLRAELLTSEKDRAENVMIVDLLRNDIGRICEFGSVEVEKLCDLEEHPSLFHLVSTVTGKLCPGLKLTDILRATFPCGSVTGAPKIRTMQIIAEIEGVPRGLSMGAIGYVGFDGTMDFSVAIRTMVVEENKAHFNVGGGIVIDSDPHKEHEETEIKSIALLEAMGVE